MEAHFRAAADIWQRLLPSDGTYSFDFEWDKDINGSTLALTTEAPNPFDDDHEIEVNPSALWFLDPTPYDNSEFTGTIEQDFFRTLSPDKQTTYFPSTKPPGDLEVKYWHQATGPAAGKIDLLSTLLHEIGHVLGISGEEPGEYNTYPHHVGGLDDVLVLEDNDSGHLAGDDNIVGWLMCEGCGEFNYRQFPSATDVLVIAEDQSLTTVRLDRVERIKHGLWNDSSSWIGGKVPDATQDVNLRNGDSAFLADSAFAHDLFVDGASTLLVGSSTLTASGRLTIEGTVTAFSTGTIAAGSILAPVAFGSIMPPGSLLRFNDYVEPMNLSRAYTFGGNISIGSTDNSGFSIVTYNPSVSAITVAGDLRVGESRSARFTIDSGQTITSTSALIGSGQGFGFGPNGYISLDGIGSKWKVHGAFVGRSGDILVSNGAELQAGSLQLGSDNSGISATVDGPVSHMTIDTSANIGPPSSTSFGQAVLTARNHGRIVIAGDLLVHGTPFATSSATAETGGVIDVKGNTYYNPYSKVKLQGSTLRTAALIPSGGEFEWFDGTLELTNQDIYLDSSSSAMPLAANTLLRRHQTLRLTGPDRDLVIGQNGIGKLTLLEKSSTEVLGGDVVVAEAVGSNGTLDLSDPKTTLAVRGSMSAGGTQLQPGGGATIHVSGDLIVHDTFTYWQTSTVVVEDSGTLSADIVRRAGGPQLNLSGLLRYNHLEGFEDDIFMNDVAVGIAEGRSGNGSFVRGGGQTFAFGKRWIIGDNAPAQVELTAGGYANGDNGVLHMGNRIGSGGTTFTVSGADATGSSLVEIYSNRMDAFVVGVSDIASLRIDNGGRAEIKQGGGAIIASEPFASGSNALVTGANSEWTVDGHIVVGGNAQGVLSVTDRGKVTTEQTLWIGGVCTFNEDGVCREEVDGEGADSIPSEVVVSDEGSVVIAHQDTHVGWDLAGTLVVTNRSQMTTDLSAFIASTSTSNGSMAVVSEGASSYFPLVPPAITSNFRGRPRMVHESLSAVFFGVHF